MLSTIKTTLNFIIYSNIWVALAAASLVEVTELLYNLQMDYEVSGLVFFATLFTYNFQRIVRIRSMVLTEDSHRHQWIAKHKTILLWLTGASGAGMLVCCWWIDWSILWLLVPAGVLSIAYALQVFNWNGKKIGLRDLPYIKIVMIAVTWMIATVWLPMAQYDSIYALLSDKAIWGSLRTFLFIVAITIPFDIRDLKYDEANKKTLPQMMGTRGAIVLSVLLVVICIGIASWEVLIHQYMNPYFYGGIVGAYLLTAVIISLANEQRHEFYFAGLVEGTMVLKYLFLLSVTML